jgi:hypothetical protein
MYLLYGYQDLLVFISRINKYIIIAHIAPLYIYSYFCLSIFTLKEELVLILYFSFYLHFDDYSVVVLLSDFLFSLLFIIILIYYD